MKEHEKLIAFLVLLAAVLALVFLASTFDRGALNDVITQGKLRIIDSAITGLLTILGMCAQALFKIGAADVKAIGDSVASAQAANNDTPQKVFVTNPPEAPAQVEVAADDSGELPASEKING